METARLEGKQIGRIAGVKIETKKAKKAKEIIKKHSKAYGGSLSDKECIELAKVDRGTYYRYKRQLLQEEGEC